MSAILGGNFHKFLELPNRVTKRCQLPTLFCSNYGYSRLTIDPDYEQTKPVLSNNECAVTYLVQINKYSNFRLAAKSFTSKPTTYNGLCCMQYVQRAAVVVKHFKNLVTCFSARVSRSAGV
jgi:hypothetical protein